MSQVSKRILARDVGEKVTRIFLETIIRVRSENLARKILEDMLSPTERIMISKRLSIFYLLEKNYDYRTIGKLLKVSMGTVAKISLIRGENRHGLKAVMQEILMNEKIKGFFNDIDNSLYKFLSRKKEVSI